MNNYQIIIRGTNMPPQIASGNTPMEAFRKKFPNVVIRPTKAINNDNVVVIELIGGNKSSRNYYTYESKKVANNRYTTEYVVVLCNKPGATDGSDYMVDVDSFPVEMKALQYVKDNSGKLSSTQFYAIEERIYDNDDEYELEDSTRIWEYNRLG